MTQTVQQPGRPESGEPKRSIPAAQPNRRKSRKIDPTFYWMFIPALVFFFIFFTAPAIIGLWFSFTNYPGYGVWDFVGIANFLSVFVDPVVLRAYVFTIGFAVATTVIVNVIAMALAIALNGKIKFKTTLRTMYFIPMVLSMIVVAYVFNYLFTTTLPGLFAEWGWTFWSSSMLSDPNWAWFPIVIVSAWAGIPAATIIYIAGLQSIDDEVYEAADIDGATAWQKLRGITLPLLFGFVAINLVLGFKANLGVYDQVVGMTNGGPAGATTSVAQVIFTGFSGGYYGYQMANAFIFLLVTLGFSIIQLRAMRRRGDV